MPTSEAPQFTISVRGYHPAQVDALLARATAALATTDPDQRRVAREALQEATLAVGSHGYDREQVDTHLRRLADQLG